MFRRLDHYRYLLPASYKKGMRIDGMVYANPELIHQIEKDLTKEQIANVATLPGLVGFSLAMPDAHQGYGFCIGGVAAADLEKGVVSAGGVGFDINCGVRLLASPFHSEEVKPKLESLLNQLFHDIPCGTGKKGLVGISKKQLDDVLLDGAQWAVRQGYGFGKDTERIEDYGRIENADPSFVSPHAKDRGLGQLGTLGSGNHFLEIQVVDEIFDVNVATRFGLFEKQVVVLINCGSRGLGHQVCTDYLEIMQDAMPKYSISVVDRQLACVPVKSVEGQNYLHAMAAAANFAFANRQMICTGYDRLFKKLSEQVNLGSCMMCAITLQRLKNTS